jgi:hypothetical protein
MGPIARLGSHVIGTSTCALPVFRFLIRPSLPWPRLVRGLILKGSLMAVMRSHPKILEELRSRIHAHHKQVVPRAGASDVQQVPFGLIDLFEV